METVTALNTYLFVLAEGCNYMEILRCYMPLLNVVGIQTLDTLDRLNLVQIVSLKENFTKANCGV